MRVLHLGRVVALAAAAVLFGVPLGTLLVVGVALLCPLMMLGMHGHGGEHQHGRPAGSRGDRAPEGDADRTE